MRPDKHAINWLVTDDEKLYFVEPQTDEVCLPRAGFDGIWIMLS